MTTRKFYQKFLDVIWLCVLLVKTSNGWSCLLSKPSSTTSLSRLTTNGQNNHNHNHIQTWIAAACTSGAIIFAPLNTPPPAFAVSMKNPAEIVSSKVTEDQLVQSLQPATASQPQIMLPRSTTSSVPTEKQPIVEGLISLANPTAELRPMSLDILVITFRSMEHPDQVLGGARVPVAKAARFPLAFRMFPKNILPGQQEATNKAMEGDLLIQVLVCPEDNPKCTQVESRMQSQAVAKLIRNLPGQGKDQTIRAPATLRLE